MVPPRSQVLTRIDMTRISTISTVLLVLIGLAAIAPSRAEARQFKTPVYYPIDGNPFGMATGDFNNDGKLDLVTAEFFTGNVAILLGKGDGSFESPRYFTAPGAVHLGVGDFNGDHIPDLAVVENGGTGHGSLEIFLGDGQGNFHSSARYELGLEPIDIAVADFNGDGRRDVAVTNRLGYGKNENDGAVLVFMGKGDGTLGPPSVYKLPGQPYGIAAGDLNGDRHPDLVVTEVSGSALAVLMNNGHGKFKHTKSYAVGKGDEPDLVAMADLDHNGTLDVVTCDAGSENIAVLLGNGDGTFGSAAFYSASKLGQYLDGLAIADFRRNGTVDVAVVLQDGYPGLFYGNGDGTFQAVVQIKSVVYPGYATVTGNFNKDGEPDLVVGAVNKGLAVLINVR